MKEADHSTKFFHKVANSHERTNTIEMLNKDGVMCTEASVIREYVADFSEQLLTVQVGWQPKLDRLAIESIEPQDISWSKRPFEESKICKVVRRMVKEST